MGYTKVQRLMLYTLGKWFKEANKRVKGKHLKVSISKVHFIEVIKGSGVAQKQIRALYKNLEALEKKKLVVYNNKELEITNKGQKLFEEIKKELLPYIVVYKKLKGKSPISYTRKIQTVFK